MTEFEVVYREEAVKHQTKLDLMKVKNELTEIHDRLRNHELHPLADKIYDLLEKTNRVLRRL